MSPAGKVVGGEILDQARGRGVALDHHHGPRTITTATSPGGRRERCSRPSPRRRRRHERVAVHGHVAGGVALDHHGPRHVAGRRSRGPRPGRSVAGDRGAVTSGSPSTATSPAGALLSTITGHVTSPADDREDLDQAGALLAIAAADHHGRGVALDHHHVAGRGPRPGCRRGDPRPGPRPGRCHHRGHV